MKIGFTSSLFLGFEAKISFNFFRQDLGPKRKAPVVIQLHESVKGISRLYFINMGTAILPLYSSITPHDEESNET